MVIITVYTNKKMFQFFNDGCNLYAEKGVSNFLSNLYLSADILSPRLVDLTLIAPEIYDKIGYINSSTLDLD